MAIQTYIKRGNAYTAALNFSGADADQIGGDYQVYVSFFHEWGEPIFSFSYLASSISAGDTEIEVLDGTQFSVGDHITFVDANRESVEISAISGNILTVGAISYFHKSGNRVSVEHLATRTSANNYSYTFTSNDVISSGNHKIRWRYVQSGISTFSDIPVVIYQPYIDSGTFFDNYPELETDFGDYFDHHERVIRDIINTFCGQSFDYFYQKTMTVDGSGKVSVYLPLRLDEFGSVSITSGEDVSELVSTDPYSKHYLRMDGSSDISSSSIPTTQLGGKWNSNLQYRITGNWGWSSVPEYVTQAAGILIADRMNDDSAYQKHGVVETYMDTHRIRFDSVILGSTGNLEADTLLMDYTLFVLGQI